MWDKTLQTNGDAGYNSDLNYYGLRTSTKGSKHLIGLDILDCQHKILKRGCINSKPYQVITPFIEKYSDEDQY